MTKSPSANNISKYEASTNADDKISGVTSNSASKIDIANTKNFPNSALLKKSAFNAKNISDETSSNNSCSQASRNKSIDSSSDCDSDSSDDIVFERAVVIGKVNIVKNV